jgi:ATP diphosphatase
MHNESLEKLRGVISTLIGPDGCPWDKKQTPESLCDNFIEEAFELVDAIRSGDKHEAMEELGDVLFLALFLAELFDRSGDFNLSDSLNNSSAKMIRRHPHVFGDCKVKDQDELLKNWEQIKRKEKKESDKIFDSLPKGLPPMLKAYRINSKAARAGFTYPSDEIAEEQLQSEWNEWQEALNQGSEAEIEEEFGDYLFTLIELGRRKGIKANTALDIANNKFLDRFSKLEDLARENGSDITDLDLDELNRLWDKIKNN